MERLLLAVFPFSLSDKLTLTVQEEKGWSDWLHFFVKEVVRICINCSACTQFLASTSL